MKWRDQKKILRGDWHLIDLDYRRKHGYWGWSASAVNPGRICLFGAPYVRVGDVVLWDGERQLVTGARRPMDPGDQAFLTVEPVARPWKLAAGGGS